MITSVIRRSALISLLALLAQAQWAHAAFVSLQPDTTYANNGDSILINLSVGDLGNFGPDSLGAFDISVSYDPGVLSFSGYSLGGFLGDISSAEALDASAGDSGSSVNLAEVSLLSPASLDGLQPDGFLLGVLGFDVIGLASGATTQLSILTGLILADGNGAMLTPSSAAGASVIGQSAIPVPATPLLLLGALFGLVATRTTSGTRRL